MRETTLAPDARPSYHQGRQGSAIGEGESGMSAKYGLAFALMAVAAMVAGSTTESTLVLLAAAWTALAFGLMAVGFLGAGPRILGKRPDGRRAGWAWPL